MSLFKRLQTLAKAKADQSVLEVKEKILKDNCLGQIDGISVCSVTLLGGDPDKFFKTTGEALALIKSLDPRRHRRVCRYLDYIVNIELISWGNFERKLKVCHIDFPRF